MEAYWIFWEMAVPLVVGPPEARPGFGVVQAAPVAGTLQGLVPAEFWSSPEIKVQEELPTVGLGLKALESATATFKEFPLTTFKLGMFKGVAMPLPPVALVQEKVEMNV